MSYARVSRHFGPILGPFWAFLGILSRKDSSSLKTRDVYGKNENQRNSTQKEQKRNEKWSEGSLIAFKVDFRVTVHQNKRNLGDFPHFSVFWWRPPRMSLFLVFCFCKKFVIRPRNAFKSLSWQKNILTTILDKPSHNIPPLSLALVYTLLRRERETRQKKI